MTKLSETTTRNDILDIYAQGDGMEGWDFALVTEDGKCLPVADSPIDIRINRDGLKLVTCTLILSGVKANPHTGSVVEVEDD